MVAQGFKQEEDDSPVVAIDAEKVERLKRFNADVDDKPLVLSLRDSKRKRAVAKASSEQGSKCSDASDGPRHSVGEIEHHMRHDPALAKVCVKLESLPDCLLPLL